MNESDWDRLIHELRDGDCTPFIGAGACYPQLPLAADFSRSWATQCGYPFADPWNLPRVMQYHVVTLQDHVIVKRLVVADFKNRGYPDFGHAREPHSLLAEFPLEVYLTTNYDDFMFSALQRNNKRPRAIICPWYENAPANPHYTLDPNFIPTANEPIVYHLHGSCEDPKSLVLTEEDYLEFLINLAQDNAADDQKIIPTAILPYFTTRPLLFIGYSLQDWTFRVIFEGLRRTVSSVQQRRHVSVQVLPPRNNRSREARDRAERYIKDYLHRYHVSVYFGEAQEFCADLRRRL